LNLTGGNFLAATTGEGRDLDADAIDGDGWGVNDELEGDGFVPGGAEGDSPIADAINRIGWIGLRIGEEVLVFAGCPNLKLSGIRPIDAPGRPGGGASHDQKQNWFEKLRRGQQMSRGTGQVGVVAKYTSSCGPF
jgi:hypothetical protein